MIILASGGIGNQLFISAAALHISETTRKRVLIISENKLFVREFRKLSPLTSRSTSISVIHLGVIGAALNKILDKLANFKYTHSIFLFWFSSRMLTLQKPWEFPFYLLKPGAKLPWILRGYFQDTDFIESLSESNCEFLSEIIYQENYQKFQSPSKSNRTVGLHIRRGDYTAITEYGTLSLAYFYENLSSLNVTDINLIVASDDPRALLEISRNFPAETLHPDYYNGFDTLRKLSDVDEFIMSNSTFSFWIGWTVLRRGGKVIAPYPWFKCANVPSGYLYLPGFKKSHSIFE